MRLHLAKIALPTLMLSVYCTEISYEEGIFASNIACISIDIVDAPPKGVFNQFMCSISIPTLLGNSQLDRQCNVVGLIAFVKVDCRWCHTPAEGVKNDRVRKICLIWSRMKGIRVV